MSTYFLSMDSSKESQTKNQKCTSGENHPTDHMAYLPREVSLDVISRLPITSLMRFRSVCKSWHNLSRDHQLVHLHLSRAENNDPCLIFHCGYPMRNWLYFVLFSDHDDEQEVVRRINPPFAASMSEFNVVGSCSGLLCLADSLFHSSLVIYNPFTGNYTELPKSVTFKHKEQRVVSGFGFHPITKQYKVIKILYYATVPLYSPPSGRVKTRCFDRSDVQILSLGSSKWRSIGEEAPYWLEFRSSGVSVNGRLHWLRRNEGYRLDGSIASFDLAEEQFRDIPKPYFGEINSLMVLQGCLSGLTYISNECLEIWVMKEYDRKETWVKQFTIEDSSVPRFNYELLPYKMWKDFFCSPEVRILCLLNNGELLIEYKGVGLATYNPESGVFRHLKFPGLPNMFLTFVHVASLNWIDTAAVPI